MGTGNYYASPVAGDGKVYLLSQRGTLSVVSAADQWQVHPLRRVRRRGLRHARPARWPHLPAHQRASVLLRRRRSRGEVVAGALTIADNLRERAHPTITARIVSRLTGSITPRSVMIALISRAGVTSNAGL